MERLHRMAAGGWPGPAAEGGSLPDDRAPGAVTIGRIRVVEPLEPGPGTEFAVRPPRQPDGRPWPEWRSMPAARAAAVRDALRRYRTDAAGILDDTRLALGVGSRLKFNLLADDESRRKVAAEGLGVPLQDVFWEDGILYYRHPSGLRAKALPSVEDAGILDYGLAELLEDSDRAGDLLGDFLLRAGISTDTELGVAIPALGGVAGAALAAPVPVPGARVGGAMGGAAAADWARQFLGKALFLPEESPVPDVANSIGNALLAGAGAALRPLAAATLGRPWRNGILRDLVEAVEVGLATAGLQDLYEDLVGDPVPEAPRKPGPLAAALGGRAGPEALVLLDLLDGAAAGPALPDAGASPRAAALQALARDLGAAAGNVDGAGRGGTEGRLARLQALLQDPAARRDLSRIAAMVQARGDPLAGPGPAPELAPDLPPNLLVARDMAAGLLQRHGLLVPPPRPAGLPAGISAAPQGRPASTGATARRRRRHGRPGSGSLPDRLGSR